jgi:hypothetical protein
MALIRNIKTACLIVFFIFFERTCFARQNKKHSEWEFGLSDSRASLGYVYDGNHYFEYGVRFDLKKKYNYLFTTSLIPGLQMTKSNYVSYVNPFVTARCYIDIDLPVIILVSINREKRLGEICYKLTPEAGFGDGLWSFTVGCNFLMRYAFSETEMFRVSLRLTCD